MRPKCVHLRAWRKTIFGGGLVSLLALLSRGDKAFDFYKVLAVEALPCLIRVLVAVRDAAGRKPSPEIVRRHRTIDFA